jgi:replicative DNA helicase
MSKQAPHSAEAEEFLLSSIFLDGVSALSKALDGHISAECFYNPGNRLLFQTFMWLHKNGRNLTLDVMVGELDRVKRLDEIGGYAFLMQVSSKVPTTAELPYFIERVRETYVLRELIRTSEQIAILARDETASVERYTHEVNRILSIRHATQTIKTIGEAADESISLAKRIMAGTATEEDMGLSWPWPEMNERFGAKQAGQLIVLAARPSIGKSSMARQDVLHVSEKYGDAALFSREMPVGELPPLFAQTTCGYSWKEFRKSRLHAKEQAEFMQALEDVKNFKKLHVFDRDRTISQIMARIKAFAQVKPLRYLAIDYLQRYDSEQSKGETRDVALGRMTMAFKDLAVDLKIPVLLLCQVGRGIEREKREPILSDLRESGNIEQDADRVIFLTAPETDKVTGCQQDIYDDTLPSIYVEAIQAKGRGDGRARCNLYLHRPTTTFRSASRRNG